MANIGSFKKVGGEFQGEIVTLSVQTKNVRIVPETNRANDTPRAIGFTSAVPRSGQPGRSGRPRAETTSRSSWTIPRSTRRSTPTSSTTRKATASTMAPPAPTPLWNGLTRSKQTLFPPAIRKMIYTTNAVESLNRSLRKIIKTRGSFPTDDAALKLLYLAIQNAGLRWRRPVEWTVAMSQFAILFGDRFVLSAR